MNYMKDIAKMLGVEIGEEFMIRNPVNKFTFDRLIYKLTEKGLIEHQLNTMKDSYEDKTLLDILYGRFEIVKLPKPILDEKEKKHLSRFIRPFRENVTHISKSNFYDCEYIEIGIHSDLEHRWYPLPLFKKDTMYKGMELGKLYSLEELYL